jgi:hypothetical protein
LQNNFALRLTLPRCLKIFFRFARRNRWATRPNQGAAGAEDATLPLVRSGAKDGGTMMKADAATKSLEKSIKKLQRGIFRKRRKDYYPGPSLPRECLVKSRNLDSGDRTNQAKNL